MENKKFYLGLDIGTNSVGYAASDENYNLLKFKGNRVWGSYTFEEGKPAVNRRSFRVARRRLERKKQRTVLLNELFAKEIAKTDENFFIRMKESALWADDKSLDTEFAIFSDKNYTDKNYHNDYKTIHHLIDELMESDRPHDVRLVYLACKYILSHRGHFLSPVSEDKLDELTSFDGVYADFMAWFEEEKPWDNAGTDIADILKQKTGVTKKLELFRQLLWDGKKPAQKEEDIIDIYSVVNLICGGTVTLSDIFKNDEYKELENNKIKLSDSEKVEAVMNEIDENHAELLDCCKKIFDWALLVDILGNEKSISKAKINIYNQHEDDLKWLKYIIRTYKSDKIYEVFKKGNGKSVHNYVAYSGNFKSVKNNKEHNKCTQEEFCKYLQKLLDNLEVPEKDKNKFDENMARIKDGTFCPKQVTTDNRVIPYQLYYHELKVILEKASGYLPFLEEKDEYGTVAEKILSIMKFRVPYYVGPLNNHHKKNSWIERKADGKILPWNFDELVDKDKSENAFINRMTCNCTYLYSCDVLPKCSMLYEKFLVLNEINSIKIDDKIGIDVATKQKIYEELFMKYKTVKLKDITRLLEGEGLIKDGEKISGISDTVKSSLKSYHNFKNLLSRGALTEEQVEEIIFRITCTEDKKRLAKWIKTEYGLSDDDINHVVKNCKCKDFGSLSRDLLTEIVPVDKDSGEITGDNIITKMWDENLNLMQILSDKYGYRYAVDMRNKNDFADKQFSLKDRLDSQRVSPAVRRAIVRTVDIVKDVSKCLNKAPDKIFIETARELGSGKKGKTTDSRKEKISKLYASIIKDYEHLKKDAERLKPLLESQENDRLRREKIFLYFMQLGKCMYSGKPIEFDDLINNSDKLDIDHIYPQAKVKDDSIDNKVLVFSEYNGAKSDKYPINSEIREKMSGMWYGYYKSKLITETKYKRLIRSTPFSDDELANFISRQLVETRQSTKAAANILKELYPETEIVYVKAGLVSEFRQENGIYKCRDVNDMHHAKDAYLNIVLGNVYNVKFTKNPINFIKDRKDEKYSLHLSKLLWTWNGNKRTGCRHIERYGVIAWNGDGSTFETVMKTYAKNTVICNRYSYVGKGELFKLMPLKKSESETDALIPLKKDLPTSRYGGYDKPQLACFILAKYFTKKNVSDIAFVPVEIIDYRDCLSSDAKKEIIIINNINKFISLKDDEIVKVEFPLKNRIIKPFTVLQLDDIYVYLRSKSNKGKNIGVSVAMPFIIDSETEEYIRKIGSFLEKVRQGKTTRTEPSREYDLIDKSTNVLIYNKILEKLSSKPYEKMFKVICKTLEDEDRKTKFQNLTNREQIEVINNIIMYIKIGGSYNLERIGGKHKGGALNLSAFIKNIAKTYKDIRIVDKSPSGLIVHKSRNLTELL